MAVICRQHKLLFIMAPRTGCTAVAHVLRSELDGEDIPPLDDPAARRAGIPPKHATLGQLMEIGAISRKERAGLLVFSAVRNPFDSVVSLYLKQSGPYQALVADETSWLNRSERLNGRVRAAAELDFQGWLEANYRRPLRRRLARHIRNVLGGTNRWLEDVDFVMRYERLQADFDQVLRRAGVARRLIIPQVNLTPGRVPDYRFYYDERARKIVESWYSSELKQFGYSF